MRAAPLQSVVLDSRYSAGAAADNVYSPVHPPDTGIAGVLRASRLAGFDTYVDNGFSGKKDSRPQLNRMMQDAHERRFDVVVVWRFDRFARSVSHLLRALETFNSEVMPLKEG
jgi:hypothetical protein